MSSVAVLIDECQYCDTFMELCREKVLELHTSEVRCEISPKFRRCYTQLENLHPLS
jgi:hypothetical protein